MKSTKKFLAIALAALMTLSLAACGEKAPVETDPVPSTTENVADTKVVGKLIMTTDACVSISYEATGLVVAVDPINGEGDTMLESYTDFVGKSCADVVAELVTLVIESNNLTRNIVIKPVVGSNVLDADFLNNVISKAQVTADAAYVTANAILVKLDTLDDYGYVDYETAKAIVLSYLELENATTFAGSEDPNSQGQYLFYVEEGELTAHYLLDATYCTVEEIAEDDPILWESENDNTPEDSEQSAAAEQEAVNAESAEAETPNATQPAETTAPDEAV